MEENTKKVDEQSEVGVDLQVSWILHPIRYIKLKTKKLAEQERLRLQDEEKKAQAELDKKRKEMFNSLCAVNNKQNCYAECTHFYKGFTTDWTHLDGTKDIYYTEPKCKLWQ